MKDKNNQNIPKNMFSNIFFDLMKKNTLFFVENVCFYESIYYICCLINNLLVSNLFKIYPNYEQSRINQCYRCRSRFKQS